MKRPNTLAEVAAKVDAGAAFGPTLSEFLDEFYVHPERRQAMIADEPAPLADEREHAMLGAVGEHLARRWGLGVPAWTNDRCVFSTNLTSLHQSKTSKPYCWRKARRLSAAA